MVKLLFSKKKIFWPQNILLLINILLLLLFWLWMFFKIKNRQDLIPLHYNIYYGIDWFGPSYYLYLYPLLATIWFLINIIFSFFWSKQNKNFLFLFFILTLLLNIFLITGSFLIVLYYFNIS